MPIPTLLQLIGNTPMVEVRQFSIGCCRLFLKLESHNPGGSIKDRVALQMIKSAEASGVLKTGGTIVEATAGNTGLGLALVASQKGYRLILVIPDKMSREKINNLRALGAEVRITRSDVGKGHPDYYQELAAKIADETPCSFYVNQFENPENPKAHETSTGPEIMAQTNGCVDAIVCGVGSGGTVTGLSRYFAKVKPSVDFVLADPEGSILAHYVRTGEVLSDAGSWAVEGIGEDFLPPIADLSRVAKAYSISDRESMQTARELLRKEGILAGSSTGTLVAAAVRYCQEQTTPKNVVSFVCDSGNKYLSKMFDDSWMLDRGLLEKDSAGDLRDLVSRSYQQKTAITLAPQDTLNVAYTRMKLYDVSQIPVVDSGKVVGLLDEFDLLRFAYQHHNCFQTCVEDVMTTNLEILSSRDSVHNVFQMLDRGLTVIVEHDGEFYGLITKIDMLRYIRLLQS